MLVEAFQWQADGGWRGGGDRAAADLVLYFGPVARLESERAAAVLSDQYPSALVFGCSSSAGILDAELDESGIVGVACHFRDTQLRLVEANVPDITCSAHAGQQLGDALRGDGLAAALILSDGVQVNGSAITSAIVDAVGKGVPVSGGLAADGASFARTLVGVGETAGTGRAAALGFYGRSIRFSHGIGGGWDPFGPRRRITRSHGCVLEELDGKPALALYERYLGDDAAGLPASALRFPLLLWDPDFPAQTVVRTVLSIDRSLGTMRFAGPVPEGWGAQLMRGHFDRLVDAASDAGCLATGGLQRQPGSQALAILVSCIGRRLLLGQRTAEELDSVNAALGPQVSKIGFYSHGEIAPSAGSDAARLHNQTMAVTLLTEAP